MAVTPCVGPLAARDAWFLYAERPETPLDIGTVYVFEGESRLPGRRGALGVEETVRERIHLVPRYRQRVMRAPWTIAHPVWIKDPHFHIGAHIRRAFLPTPGTRARLRASGAGSGLGCRPGSRAGALPAGRAVSRLPGQRPSRSRRAPARHAISQSTA